MAKEVVLEVDVELEKSDTQQEEQQQQVPVLLLKSPAVDKYVLSCIVCYDTIEISEYKDLEHSLCVIEVDKESGADSGGGHMTLPCCSRLVCKNCINGIISTVVGEGRLKITCPHPECGEVFSKEYVYSALNDSDQANTKQRYQRLLVDAGIDGKIKTCPQCSHLTEHVLPGRFRLKESDLRITCEVCEHEWCFRCHAPWHTGLTCKEFKSGNREFKSWTKRADVRGVPNCQKCPTCRIYIQRSTGCPHMQCDRCGTEFCYECGGRFLELGCIDHYSTLNVWGCKDNYYPDNPCIRHSVRWGYLFAKLSYVLAYPVLFIVTFALVVLLLMIGIPVYCCCKCCSYACFRMETNRVKKLRYQQI